MLTELSDGSPNILLLAFHVAHWDQSGWLGLFALPDARRGSGIAACGVIGLDRADVQQALTAASPVTQRVRRVGGEAVVDAAAGGAAGSALLQAAGGVIIGAARAG